MWHFMKREVQKDHVVPASGCIPSPKRSQHMQTPRVGYNFELAPILYPCSSSTVFATRPTTGKMLICMNACSELACRLA